MQNNSKLIGTIDPQQELSIEISQRHLSDLETLVNDYGWVGEGLKPAFGNPHIQRILHNHQIDTVNMGQSGINFKDASGNSTTLPEPEQRVLEDILIPQYNRSVGLIDIVRKGEFERYNKVGWGALKGLSAGAVIAGIFDILGLSSAATETGSRFVPGILEASSLSNQVQKRKREYSGGGLFNKVKDYSSELALDMYNVAGRVPANMYNVVNIFKWADRVRGKMLPKTMNEKLEKILGLYNGASATQTDLWSKSQESAPYRGAISLLALGYLPVRYVNNIFYGMADSFAVFWTNSGNNVEGSSAVYGDIYRNLPKKSSSVVKNAREAFSELWSDPFQRANIVGCAVWFGVIAGLRSYGIRLEEYLGRVGMSNLAAAGEAAAIGFDTVVIAAGARHMEHRRVADLPKWDLNPVNLLYLANKYGSQELMDSLSDSRNPITFATYHGGKATIHSYRLTDTVKDKFVHGAHRAKESIVAGINTLVNFVSKNIS